MVSSILLLIAFGALLLEYQTSHALSLSSTSYSAKAAAALSQKSVLRETLSMTTTKRLPIRMPSQTPQVPYMPPGSDYAQFIDIDAAMYRDRTLMINRYIDQEYANQIISIILYLRKENPRETMSLYFNVPGA